MLRKSAVVLLSLLLAGCGVDIVADSTELDRALVPAIDLARHRELEPAQAAMAELLPVWKEFHRRYHDYRPTDPDWAATFAEIDTLVADIVDIIEDGDDLAFAAASLVDMRLMLAELRESAGIEYYLDVLAELWEPAEELDDLARRRDPDNVTPGDFTAFSVLLDEIDDALQDIVETPFDAARFGFDGELTDELFQRLDALADAGAELASALAENSAVAALGAARIVFPLYLEVYRLFGDYNLTVESEPDPDGQ